MTGFSAIIGATNSAETRHQLSLMLASVDWHSHTVRNTWHGSVCSLGHIRLQAQGAKIRRPFNIFFEAEGVAVMFDGWLERRAELLATLAPELAGTPSDTDSLLIARGYRRWGDALPDHLDGQYSVVIWDSSEQCLLAFRDRFGSRGLVYTQLGEMLLLASLPVSIVAHPLVTREQNLDYIARQVLEWTTVPSTSFFKHAHRLVAAHAMKWRGGKVTIYRYWQPSRGRAQKMSDEEVITRCRSLLKQAVLEAIPRGEPTMLNLSGGLDSTSVCFAANSLVQDGLVPASQLMAGTLIYPGFACDETQYSDPAARSLRFRAQKHPGFGRPLAELEALTRRLGEPLPYTNHTMFAPMAYGLIAEGGTVCLTGQSGDELLRQGRPLVYELLQPDNWRAIGQYLRTVKLDAKVDPRPYAALRLLKHHWLPGLPVPTWMRTQPPDLGLDAAWDGIAVGSAEIVENGAFPAARIHTLVRSASAVLLNPFDMNDALARVLGIELRDPLRHMALVNFAEQLPVRWLDWYSPRLREPFRRAFEQELPSEISSRTDKADFLEVIRDVHPAYLTALFGRSTGENLTLMVGDSGEQKRLSLDVSSSTDEDIWRRDAAVMYAIWQNVCDGSPSAFH